MQHYRKEVSRENLKMRNPETTRGRNCKNTPQIFFFNCKILSFAKIWNLVLRRSLPLRTAAWQSSEQSSAGWSSPAAKISVFKSCSTRQKGARIDANVSKRTSGSFFAKNGQNNKLFSKLAFCKSKKTKCSKERIRWKDARACKNISARGTRIRSFISSFARAARKRDQRRNWHFLRAGTLQHFCITRILQF